MKARGWALAAVALVSITCVGLAAAAASPVMTAEGSAWVFFPPTPPQAPNGYDFHLVFSVRAYADGSCAGNASLRVFDGASGKLLGVLTAVKQTWLDGGRVWGAELQEPWFGFWTQFELKQGAVHPLLLLPWSWWVHDNGADDEIVFHFWGPFEVLKGNVTVHVS